MEKIKSYFKTFDYTIGSAEIPTCLLRGSLLPSLDSLAAVKTEGNSEVIWRGVMHLDPNILPPKNRHQKEPKILNEKVVIMLTSLAKV